MLEIADAEFQPFLLHYFLLHTLYLEIEETFIYFYIETTSKWR